MLKEIKKVKYYNSVKEEYQIRLRIYENEDSKKLKFLIFSKEGLCEETEIKGMVNNNLDIFRCGRIKNWYYIKKKNILK